MSLSDFCRNLVDVEQLDDHATGSRGGKRDTWTTVATAVRCGVHELRAEAVAEFGRIDLRVSHKVKFPAALKTDAGAPLALDDTHRLSWTDPETGQVRKLMVKGYRRPRIAGFPWVALAEEKRT